MVTPTATVHAIVVPEVGESIAEVRIVRWLKHEGQWTAKDESLVEIETDKATVELPAPVAGVITKILKRDGETAAVGDTVGYLDEKLQPKPAQASQAATSQEAQTEAEAEIHGCGRVAQRPGARETDEPVHAPTFASATAPAEQSAPPRPESPHLPEGTPDVFSTRPTGPVPRQEESLPMSPMRRRIAERLLKAQQNAALLTTFAEIDMAAVTELRQKYREEFRELYNAKLGFMSFFVKAVIEGLKLVPELNAEVRGAEIVYRNYYDIGIAVGGGKALVVPVLRNAERMSFAEIERAIADFARQAHENKLKPESLEGGTFTISNGGIYGSLLSTPIVNPPQSGILGMHAVQDRPVARSGQIVIRPMMYVALTYDHRVVDGREAVGFLRRVKEIIEDPARLLLEI